MSIFGIGALVAGAAGLGSAGGTETQAPEAGAASLPSFVLLADFVPLASSSFSTDGSVAAGRVGGLGAVVIPCALAGNDKPLRQTAKTAPAQTRLPIAAIISGAHRTGTTRRFSTIQAHLCKADGRRAPTCSSLLDRRFNMRHNRRHEFCGEVAKWLGNGLQNRYTRVRIPSSPPQCAPVGRGRKDDAGQSGVARLSSLVRSHVPASNHRPLGRVIIPPPREHRRIRRLI